jgi:hypothetical protein
VGADFSVLEPAKPWRDPQNYKRGQLLEAKYEAEPALRFLEEGAVPKRGGQGLPGVESPPRRSGGRPPGRVGRAVQRSSNRDGRRVQLADFVMAFMTAGYMLAVAKALDASAGTKSYDLTNAALSLHELQYDGLDRPGIYGRYPFVDLGPTT